MVTIDNNHCVFSTACSHKCNRERQHKLQARDQVIRLRGFCFVVTLAMLLHLINCRFIIIITITIFRPR